MKPKWIQIVGLLAAAAAVVLAIAGADVKHPDANPESAIALAIVAFAMLQHAKA